MNNIVVEVPWKFSGTILSVVDNELFEEIPVTLQNEFGEVATELTINFCSLKCVCNLENFQKLVVLNLDSNCIEDFNVFPRISTLETLWLNSNRISRLEFLLNQIADSFSNLTYLSLLKKSLLS